MVTPKYNNSVGERLQNLFVTKIHPDLAEDSYYIQIDPGKLPMSVVWDTAASVDADFNPQMRAGVLDGKLHLGFEAPESAAFMHEFEERLYDAARANIPEMAEKTNREICNESEWDFSRGPTPPIKRPEFQEETDRQQPMFTPGT